MKRFLCLLAFAATASAFAQQATLAPALVKVDLATVAPSIAKNINVDASKVPTSLEVPVGIAATACGVSASTLAPQTSGPAACNATSTSKELDQLVQRQLKATAKP